MFFFNFFNSIEQYENLRASFNTTWKIFVAETENQYGVKDTCWDRVFDIETRKTIYLNSNTGERREEQNGAICETCDAFIEKGDYKCFSCGAKRSKINEHKYRGRLPLADMIGAEKIHSNISSL